MKKIRLACLTLLMAGMLSSCGIIQAIKGDPMMKVQSGMSKEQVTKLLGKPAIRSFEGKTEQWEYTDKKTGRIMVIGFVDNVVSKMDSYTDRQQRDEFHY